MGWCKVKEEINITKTLEELINRFGTIGIVKERTSTVSSDDD